MDRERQLDILDRMQAHREAGNTTDLVETLHREPVSNYTDQGRYQAELDQLFRRQPLLAAMTGDLPEPGDYVTLDVVDVPVVLVRQADRSVRAFRNVCRHRGACVAEGRGHAAKTLTCPYHAWSYGLDGSLVAVTSRAGFADLDRDTMGLAPVACDETAGLIFIQLEQADGSPAVSLDAAAHLHGALDELAPFDFSTWVPTEIRTSDRAMNWKLMFDTFCEVYHIQSLHKATIAPLIMSSAVVFDPFGPHSRLAVPRWSISELDDAERASWELLPHATIVYLLAPNTVFIYQQDHVEMWQIFPDGPDRAIATITLYTPEAPATEKVAAYWKKNIDLLMQVTETEDFIMCEQIQRSFRSGAQDHITFGANEPNLAHFHQSLDRLLAAGA